MGEKYAWRISVNRIAPSNAIYLEMSYIKPGARNELENIHDAYSSAGNVHS